MTTPSPGRGWRWLRVGAIPRKGDEHNLHGPWRKSRAYGFKVEDKHTYRRRVKKKRLLWFTYGKSSYG